MLEVVSPTKVLFQFTFLSLLMAAATHLEWLPLWHWLLRHSRDPAGVRNRKKPLPVPSWKDGIPALPGTPAPAGGYRPGHLGILVGQEAPLLPQDRMCLLLLTGVSPLLVPAPVSQQSCGQTQLLSCAHSNFREKLWPSPDAVMSQPGMWVLIHQLPAASPPSGLRVPRSTGGRPGWG